VDLGPAEVRGVGQPLRKVCCVTGGLSIPHEELKVYAEKHLTSIPSLDKFNREYNDPYVPPRIPKAGEADARWIRKHRRRG